MKKTQGQKRTDDSGASDETDVSPGSSEREAPTADADQAPTADADLSSLIRRLDLERTPRDEWDYETDFRTVRRAIESSGSEPDPELVWEEIAFSFHAHDHQEPSAWGLYFGPMMSAVDNSGQNWETPALASVTGDALKYWRKRAAETPNPVMRGRYADLLWELPKKLKDFQPDAAMARVAVDSYIAAINEGLYGHDVTAVGKSKRAIELSLSIKDQTRIEQSRDAMISLERRVAADNSPGLWGFSFDFLVERGNAAIALDPAVEAALVTDMEARLQRLSGAPGDEYHPAPAEAAALRLATYYRRKDRTDDVKRVLHSYGTVVAGMHGKAAPIVELHSLEQLYDTYKRFEMKADADALNQAMRSAGEAGTKELKPITVTTEISSEKVEQYFDAMLKGTSMEVLARIVIHFVPKRAEVESQIRELAEKAPISFLFPHVVLDEDGRSVASIGSLDADPEGHLFRQISQNVQLGAPWLREVFARGSSRSVFSLQDMLTFMYESPVFDERRRSLVAAGLTAHTNDDAVTAIHLLVPQIEHAVRQLASRVNAPIYSFRRRGGLYLRTLNELLCDSVIEQAIGPDIPTYFRVLLTDPRGLNVRNTVCHGLTSSAMLNMGVADRIVHTLLVLGLLRERSDEPNKGP